MGWGITKREPPDKRSIEMTKEEKQNKIVKRVKWQDQPREKKLKVAALMFDGDGEYRREKSRKHGRDEQTGADRVKQAAQESTGEASGERPSIKKQRREGPGAATRCCGAQAARSLES